MLGRTSAAAGSQNFLQESADGGLGSPSTLTGHTHSRKGRSDWWGTAWRKGAKAGVAVPSSGEPGGKPQSVWETEQARA